MSTYWYYECQDHSPKLMNDDGINHGEEGLDQLLSLRNKFSEILTDWEWPLSVDIKVHGSSNPYQFLLEHKSCRVMIKSEYGDYFINKEVFKKEQLPS